MAENAPNFGPGAAAGPPGVNGGQQRSPFRHIRPTAFNQRPPRPRQAWHQPPRPQGGPGWRPSQAVGHQAPPGQVGQQPCWTGNPRHWGGSPSRGHCGRGAPAVRRQSRSSVDPRVPLQVDCSIKMRLTRLWSGLSVPDQWRDGRVPLSYDLLQVAPGLGPPPGPPAPQPPAAMVDNTWTVDNPAAAPWQQWQYLPPPPPAEGLVPLQPLPSSWLGYVNYNNVQVLVEMRPVGGQWPVTCVNGAPVSYLISEQGLPLDPSVPNPQLGQHEHFLPMGP